MHFIGYEGIIAAWVLFDVPFLVPTIGKVNFAYPIVLRNFRFDLIVVWYSQNLVFFCLK